MEGGVCEGWKGECVRGGRESVRGEGGVCEGWKGECVRGGRECVRGGRGSV